MILRPYQADVVADVQRSWAAGNQNILSTLPTGAGKTAIFSYLLSQEPGVTFAIAHRQELIFQISMALARFGVVHNIQGDNKTIRYAVKQHLKAFGRHYYNESASCILAGVLTLINRADMLERYIKQTRLWVIDECQHTLRTNTWGKAIALFPKSARGLGVTATPLRSDGNGLGRHADGLYDDLIVGPGMRELINAGYLSEYRIFAPRTFIDLSHVAIGKTGDFSKPQLTTAVRKSQIVGDVVGHYLKIAPGKRGVTFVTDVETGREMAAKFNAAGVPSALVHAKTAYSIRQEVNAKLVRGDLKNVVNVDIYGEGFDCPDIEVCSFARPTESYGLYVQQFGRALRPLDGKAAGIIIDHVGNVERHSRLRGLPDSPQVWTLDRREKNGNGNGVKLPSVRVCIECTAVYEAYLQACPYCGCPYKPEGRSTIEQVEGDLLELSPETLAAMRGEVDRIDAPESVVGDKMRHAGAPIIAVAGAMKNHRVRREAQTALRDSIALWAGYQRAAGNPDAISYRRFYRTFGMDVMTAKALGAREAEALDAKVRGSLA